MVFGQPRYRRPNIPGTPEDIYRAFIAAEALSWIGTPYQLRQRVKGAACDCYTFIAETMIACRIITEEVLPIYHGDWWAHISDEEYILKLLRYTKKTFQGQLAGRNKVKCGNVLLVRAAGTRSKISNHGAVVTDWPFGVHAVDPKVELCDLTKHPMWALQPVAVFDPFEKVEA